MLDNSVFIRSDCMIMMKKKMQNLSKITNQKNDIKAFFFLIWLDKTKVGQGPVLQNSFD